MSKTKPKSEKTKFKLRAAAVAVRNGKVLIYQFEGSEYWSLPGGRLERNEDSRQALAREMREEAGLSIQIKRLLWVSENFFTRANGTGIHEVSFYYLIDLDRQDELPFEGLEGDTRLYFRWVEIDRLSDIQLVPAFLKLSLAELPASPQHLITRKLKP